MPINTIANRRITYTFSTALFISLLLFLFVILITSCNAKHKQSNELPGTDTTAVKIDLPAPTPLPPAEANRIRQEATKFYDSYYRDNGFNGGVLVAKDGNIVYEQYKGSVGLQNLQPVTEHTAFHIASVTKTFTAMVVCKLWQEGKIDIDLPFKHYFPEFNYDGVTVRNLLSHRSGLPNYLYFMEKLWLDKTRFVSNSDVLQMLITQRSTLEDVSAPNTHFTYCNTNYALLALLIEKVTGKTYPNYMQEEIFTPLGMDDSFVYLPGDSAKVTPSFDWRGSKIPFSFLDNVYGDKNIYSTPRDLLLWDRYLRSGLFVNQKTLEAAYTPYSNEHAGVKNYGLGWRMDLYDNGKKLVFHNGWWHGNNAVFMRLLDENATIIVVNNRFTRATYKAKLLANIFYPYFNDVADDAEEGLTDAAADSVKVDSAKTAPQPKKK